MNAQADAGPEAPAWAGPWKLAPQQRRCLCVLSTYPDIAFAARRLHLARGALLDQLRDMAAQLGDGHINIEPGGRVRLSEALRRGLQPRSAFR